MTNHKVRKSTSFISTLREALSFSRKDEGSLAGSLGTPIIRSDPVPVCFRRPASAAGATASSQPNSLVCWDQLLDDCRDAVEESGVFTTNQLREPRKSHFVNCARRPSLSPHFTTGNSDVSFSMQWDDEEQSECALVVGRKPVLSTREMVEEWIKGQMTCSRAGTTSDDATSLDT
uniref:Uncharacterized protein TCIL3000_4_2060 n=1 Tax=Trypanosoma congolense (strain IL3000) TaxID=1068625 RepID=G0UL61_TRYCI|nr:unnamed protein product [Trypanosoma congolense IL3000]